LQGTGASGSGGGSGGGSSGESSIVSSVGDIGTCDKIGSGHGEFLGTGIDGRNNVVTEGTQSVGRGGHPCGNGSGAPGKLTEGKL
jgi:hypothetical protein